MSFRLERERNGEIFFCFMWLFAVVIKFSLALNLLNNIVNVSPRDPSTTKTRFFRSSFVLSHYVFGIKAQNQWAFMCSGWHSLNAGFDWVASYVNVFVIYCILRSVSLCKVYFYINISTPHCHFDWSGSGMEKSFFGLCDCKTIVFIFIW